MDIRDGRVGACTRTRARARGHPKTRESDDNTGVWGIWTAASPERTYNPQAPIRHKNQQEGNPAWHSLTYSQEIPSTEQMQSVGTTSG
jgi:hypothetical protein